MVNNRVNEIINKFVDEDLFNEKATLTQEEIDFLKNNPGLLNKIIDTAI